MLGGSWTPWEEPSLPHPTWLAAWKSLHQLFRWRRMGGGAGVCVLEREKHGASGPRSVPVAQTPSSSMSSTRSGHVVHATAKAAAGRRAGSHPKLLCFCNTKVETERQGRGSPTCSSLPVRRPAAALLRVWGCRQRQRCWPDFQHRFCCPSGDGIHCCLHREWSTIKNAAISG